jgi:hypothetical protein
MGQCLTVEQDDRKIDSRFSNNENFSSIENYSTKRSSKPSFSNNESGISKPTNSEFSNEIVSGHRGFQSGLFF